MGLTHVTIGVMDEGMTTARLVAVVREKLNEGLSFSEVARILEVKRTTLTFFLLRAGYKTKTETKLVPTNENPD